MKNAVFASFLMGVVVLFPNISHGQTGLFRVDDNIDSPNELTSKWVPATFTSLSYTINYGKVNDFVEGSNKYSIRNINFKSSIGIIPAGMDDLFLGFGLGINSGRHIRTFPIFTTVRFVPTPGGFNNSFQVFFSLGNSGVYLSNPELNRGLDSRGSFYDAGLICRFGEEEDWYLGVVLAYSNQLVKNGNLKNRYYSISLGIEFYRAFFDLFY